MMAQYLAIPRIGSVTVRHSRVELSERRGSGPNHNEIKSETFQKTTEERGEEDRNWSLVDLLNRSGSSKKRLKRPTSTQSAFSGSRNHDTSLLQGKPETAKNPRARLWRRPDLRLNYDHHHLYESCEDTENEGSEYFCPVSSGSSISWADDAAETGQSENLAKLWREVEAVCAGEPRPENMSDEVYDECQLWRRAFPVEASSRMSRFESMAEFFDDSVEDDDDLTPTNLYTVVGDGLGRSSRLRKDVQDQDKKKDSMAMNTTDVVTSWLSSCELNGENDKEILEAGDVQPKEISLQTPVAANSRNLQDIEIPYFPNDIASQSRPTFLPSSRLPRRTALHGNDLPFRNILEIEELPLAPKESENGFQKLNSAEKTDQRSSSSLTLQIPHENKVNSRQNFRKPFLLWVFDRISPS